MNFKCLASRKVGSFYLCFEALEIWQGQQQQVDQVNRRRVNADGNHPQALLDVEPGTLDGAL
jgi:FKBP-type peptidyl-prolyl cis-trans isomerase 2